MYNIEICTTEFINNQSGYGASQLKDYVARLAAPVSVLGPDLAPSVQQSIQQFYLGYQPSASNLYGASYTNLYTKLTADVSVRQ